MYRKYYGLTKKPFDLTPDPDTVFLSETHDEGLAILNYGLISKKTFLVLTADVGSGKSTLLQALITSLGEDVHICLLDNPTLYRDEFFAYLARELKLEWNGNKADFLETFKNFLIETYKKGEQVLIIVDEAHVLPVDLLEELRLLSNMKKKDQDLLSIFLVGQPELNEHMNNDRLLPLRQRIGIRFHLSRFDLDETRQYIHFRLRKAGARNPGIFNEEAINLIHKVSKGTPRLINIVCDHALISGYSLSKPVIDHNLIKETVSDLHFPGEDNPLPVAKPSRPKYIKYIALFCAALTLIGVTMLILELNPATRQYSILNKILPEHLIQRLH